ncbi:MAG: serine/threonine protein kinase [Verrucomicrobia bacterium]|nr:serine/threonine protein kinase [Verrucomicrobiota bacterium]
MNDETLPKSPQDQGLFTPTGGARPGPAPGRDQSGVTLGGCRLVRKIAEGGMGEIYEAVQTALDRKVAVKIVAQQLAGRGEFLQRFEREAKAAAALNHPNVVHVHDFGQAGGQFYLVMEFVEGEDFSSHVSRHGKLAVADALSVIEQAARALKAALEKSIIHRDIKPANLLRTTDGHVKVSDLGLAKVLDDDTEVTQTGEGLGSPHYLAPEQADDARHADHRADIYSLGITLLFLLTGKRPFEGASSYSIVLAHAGKALPTGAELGTPLPEAVEALIRKMAAKKPEERHADYDALLADLERVKAGFAPVLKNSAKSKIFRLAAAAALLAIAALIAVNYFKHDEPPPPVASPAPPQKSSPTAKKDFERDDSGFALNRPPPGKKRGEGGRRGPPALETRYGTLRFAPHRYPVANSPLPDAPPATMLALADEYAKTNATQYINVIHAYRQVIEAAAGSPIEDKAHAKSDEAIARHQQATFKVIAEFEARMLVKVKAGDLQGAYDVWREFPGDLFVPEPEVSDPIKAAIERNLPADFVPKER